MRQILKFLEDTRGSVATSMAVMAVPLMLAVGTAVDYHLMYRAEATLQAAADASALASARELGITSTNDEALKEAAAYYVYSNLPSNSSFERTEKTLQVNTRIDSSRLNVTVDVDYYWTPLFLHYIYEEALPIKVSATAGLAGNESVCVVALDPTADHSMALTGVSRIAANNCAIYSNSTSQTGVSLVKGAAMQASNTYTAGGYTGFLDGYFPRPITDSPTIDDPLEQRSAPTVGLCDHNGTEIKVDTVLSPGVYCGGIKIKGKTTTLQPGTYIIKDGPLALSGNSTLIGEDVGFYFTGDTSVFDFEVSTQVKLSAPKSGLMAGMLFFEDRTSPANRKFTIRSKDAERFEGTVYLPKGKLVVDKESRVGQLSDWTAIIANRIEIKKGPNLVINSDYAGSDIPVPEGILPSGAKVTLSR